jgi:hypothetical protein
MGKFRVRVYLSSYVDVEVDADNAKEAIESVEKNSDTWYTDNQILEHLELGEGLTEVTEL